MDQSPKDGTRLAKRSFFVLGIVYVVFAVSGLVPGLALVSLLTFPLKMVLVGAVPFYSNPMMPYALLLVGIVLITARYLLVKRNIIGVYLGWLFILVWAFTIYSSNILLNILPVVVLVSIIYANYKAHNTLRSEQSSVSI